MVSVATQHIDEYQIKNRFTLKIFGNFHQNQDKSHKRSTKNYQNKKKINIKAYSFVKIYLIWKIFSQILADPINNE